MNKDVELTHKLRKTSEKISENIHIVANDPSLAFFRIQEHVRKVLPPIVEKRAEVIQLQNDLQGHCYDMEYAVSAVEGIDKSDAIFKNIQDMLKTSIFLKQQLKYEETKSRTKRESSQNSVYKRFSAHLTLDLNDLPDFSGVMRETTNRVENMMSNRSSAPVDNPMELQRSHTTLH
ncbi:BLOC-1-related complex subunit 8 homolog [Episyrphus balteatus]|uniref:BLOC-1-related complex subunit 8 homolog n=1 Tax=Episyrphus balteatus TaxID=286459 RepID=UPI0024857779|nr:BLOC-1-related complex subunit 8 homolog [Episyrphus balteatus]